MDGTGPSVSCGCTRLFSSGGNSDVRWHCNGREQGLWSQLARVWTQVLAFTISEPGSKTPLLSALQFPPRWKDNNSTHRLRWLWGLNEMWPIKRRTQHVAHGKHLIILVWSLSKYNLQSMPHRRGVPCLGLAYTQDAVWFAGHKQTPHLKGCQKDFYLGCICKRASCTPCAASCIWECATTVPEPHAGLLPKTSSSFSRGTFPPSLEVGLAQEHMTTSCGPWFRALRLGTH